MVIKQFDRLYTLDTKKKIRVFDCIVETGLVLGCYTVTTSTGLLNGKLIEHNDLIKIGKQNRTVEQQALFIANSLFEDKFDEGYKNIPLLCTKEPIGNIGGEEAIVNYFKKHPEASYTNKNWDELPMLAKKFKDVKSPNYPYFAQPKLNGVRCLVKRDKEDNIRLCSRGGQYYSIPHLENALRDLFFKIFIDLKTDPRTILLDGEIYVHGRPLQEISGAARKEESGLFQSNSWLEYHIYDVIDLSKNEDQTQRYQNLCAVNLLKDSNILKVINTSIVNNKEEVIALHDRYVSEGYEGLILREQFGEYKFNERSSNLLKVKQYQDEEFEIVGCEYDDNNIGESFVFTLINNQGPMIAKDHIKRFNSRPTGTIEQKEHWCNNISQYLGKMATVRFFERSKDGLPQQGSVQHKISEVLHIRPKGE